MSTAPLPTKLIIAGTTYTATQRATAGLIIDDVTLWDLDGDLECSFHESGTGAVSPTFHGGQSVSVQIDSGSGYVTRMFGEISGVETASLGDEGWLFSYRARGPKYLGNRLFVTGRDAGGTMSYDLSPQDDGYVASLAGLTVGAAIADLLSVHSTALAAIGITIDGTTTTQLASGFLGSITPPEPMNFEGRVFQAIDGVLQQWARNFVSHVGGDGLLRFIDTLGGTTLTLTEDSDEFDPLRLGYDLSETFTRVVVRGQSKVFPWYARLSDNTLTPTWNDTQEDAWASDDYTAPKDAYDTGTVNSIGSSTTIVLHSDDTAKTWTSNFWPGREAWIYLTKASGTGVTFSEQRPITSNTSLSAGGTSTITVAFPLDNAGGSAYDKYRIVGTAGALGATGNNLVDVYRLFNIADTGGLVSGHLVPEFPVPIPFFSQYGNGYITTRFPTATIQTAPFIHVPVPFQIVPQTGQIRFSQPVVNLCNTPAILASGGDGVVMPADIYVLLAYARGALTSTYPPDSGGPVYSGTAHTLFGYDQTLYVNVDSWIYAGNQGLLDNYAQMLQQAKCNVPFQAPLKHKGWLASAFVPPIRLDIVSTSYTTSFETLAIPIRSYRLRYFSDGSAGLLNGSEFGLSARRDTNTGDRYWVHPTTLEQMQFKLGSSHVYGTYDGRSNENQSDNSEYGTGFGYTPIQPGGI